MKKIVTFVLSVIFGLCVNTRASLFTDNFGDFVSNHADGWGTTFVPAQANIDPVSTVIPQTVYLTDWTFARTSNSQGYGTTAGQTYLAVYSALSVAEMNDSTLLGISTTWVETTQAAASELMTWQFDYLALDKDTQYALMFVQYDISDNPTIVRCGVELEVGNPYSHGGWIRVNEVANDWDPDFVATYSTVVPEPVSVSLLALGALSLRRRRTQTTIPCVPESK